MYLLAFGGPPPKHEAWADEEEASPGAGLGSGTYLVQAVNSAMTAMLTESAAIAQKGVMRYKAIQALNTLGCVCLSVFSLSLQHLYIHTNSLPLPQVHRAWGPRALFVPPAAARLHRHACHHRHLQGPSARQPSTCMYAYRDTLGAYSTCM